MTPITPKIQQFTVTNKLNLLEQSNHTLTEHIQQLLQTQSANFTAIFEKLAPTDLSKKRRIEVHNGSVLTPHTMANDMTNSDMELDFQEGDL